MGQGKKEDPYTCGPLQYWVIEKDVPDNASCTFVEYRWEHKNCGKKSKRSQLPVSYD